MAEEIFHKELFIAGSKNCFVFGSNLAGRHGKGAALFAKEHCGAIYGHGLGLQGNSYAIPTKDENIKTLPLDAIHNFVNGFVLFATQNPDMIFYVTRVGCGLAGYKDIDIAPMFKDAPSNCILPKMWQISDQPLLITE
jgi:hypothetical protein